VFKMYSNESKGGKYPTLKRWRPACTHVNPVVDHELIFDGPAVYPEYCTDANIMICPSDTSAAGIIKRGLWNRQPGDLTSTFDACRLTSISYTYFGWALDNDDRVCARNVTPELDTRVDPLQPVGPITGAPTITNLNMGYYEANFLTRLKDILDSQSTNNNEVDKDLTFVIQHPLFDGESVGDKRKLLQLKEGIERFLVRNINNAAATNIGQSELAIMWDNTSTKSGDFNHVPGGSNVLYMDGHVEFVKFKAALPSSMAWAAVMESVKAASALS